MMRFNSGCKPSLWLRALLDRSFLAHRGIIHHDCFDRIDFSGRRAVSDLSTGPLDEFQRAHIDPLQTPLAFISSRGTDATPLLMAAARRLEPLDIGEADTELHRVVRRTSA